jgi:archaellin
MKESVTKFDLESAFKALDEIDIPVVDKGIRANKPALTEIFSRKSKFDALFEEYYDIDSAEGLDDAKAAREAEVAKAKLDRIEKIVDLDADSPEDLLTSYVGKYIMQCPQCMTLFYKDKEDIVESEDDPNTVNVNEVCQHCGNEAGYTLVGKVGEAEAEESTEELPAELDVENTDLEPLEDEATEEVADGDLEEIDLEAISLDDKPAEEEEEKTEEAFVAHTGEPLVEDIQDDKELDAKLEAHNEYIEYLRNMIAQEEVALEKAGNEQIKVAIQRNIDAFKADLENALPDAVKNDEAIANEASTDTEDAVDEEPVTEGEEVTESLTEALHEETDYDVSADEFEDLIKSPEFEEPVSDVIVRAMINKEAKKEAEGEDEDEKTNEALEEGVFDKLKDKAADAFDKLTSKLKSREAKADWISKHAMNDYSQAKFDNKGELVPDKNTRRFNAFMVIGYKNRYSNGVLIKTAPEPNNKNLVPGMDAPKVGETYKSADDTAKGWSMREGNGPAVIYLAKNEAGDDAVFLCQYLNGKLYNDNVEKYFEVVKNNIKGAALEARGNMKQDDKKADDTTETKEIKASEVKEGMKLKVDEGIGEVTKIGASKFANHIMITVKLTSGEKNLDLDKDGTVAMVVESATTESVKSANGLSMIMEQLDELQESTLEHLISDSLIEAYGNVAGFRLAGCEYLNEQFTVSGTIHFTSGNTRQTTYRFTEAFVSNGKVTMNGLNEKLGLDKKFTLTGKVDKTNKTFITESFRHNK